MQLVKPALDVGLYTNNLDPVLTFWQQQANVPFSELLPVGVVYTSTDMPLATAY